MSPNRRIFLNVVATYGRSLYTIAVGLFCGRWTLMALGQTDYGLMGLVGGLITFVTFINNLLSESVGRFYAVSIGAARKKGNEANGLEDCRRWFNTAVVIYTLIPVLLIAIGYPIGMWAVNNFLTIPVDRVEACRWVFRFSCLSCLISMMNVPFRAMYGAKQEIAELTLYGFATTTFNAMFLYYMVTHPGVWLVKFSAFSLLLSAIPQLIIAVRAFYKYNECRIVLAYLWDFGRCKAIFAFALARFISGFSGMLCGQGPAILVNKYVGPAANASVAVGTSVSGHAMTLSSAMSGAFSPAIANKAGEGDMAGVERMCMMVCRLGSIMILVFAMPLALEAHEVLRLWLVNPPQFAAELCIAFLAVAAFERMADGYRMAILSCGVGVLKYSLAISLGGIALVSTAWACFALGFGMWSLVAGFAAFAITMISVHLYMAHILLGYRILQWWRHVLIPILLLMLIVLSAGFMPRLCIEPSFWRVVLTTMCCEVVFVPGVWFFVLNGQERIFIRERVLSRIPIVGEMLKGKV